MPLLPRITFLALATTVGACRSFEPPQVATLARIRPMPLVAAGLLRFEFELASPVLTGTFDGVFAVTARGFRLQLFPDVGGKVMDLEFTGDTITASLPGSSYVATAPFDSAPPHLALVLAALFAELLDPVDGRRVRGERIASGGTEVKLEPVLGSGEVVATLAADGAVAAYTVELGHLWFRCSADGRLAGRSFTGQLRFPASVR